MLDFRLQTGSHIYLENMSHPHLSHFSFLFWFNFPGNFQTWNLHKVKSTTSFLTKPINLHKTQNKFPSPAEYLKDKSPERYLLQFQKTLVQKKYVFN